MPDPHPGEKLSAFVGKYMGSAHAKKKFPKRKQRVAVALSEGRAARLKS